MWPHTYADDSAVKRNIMLLRRAIEPPAGMPHAIKTQRGQGYRFVQPVTVVDTSPEPSATPLRPSYC